MLVESMTHAEVYRELERDRDTATTWWRHHLDTLRRPVLKARQLPLIHWADYTSPARRIRYLFFTRIFDKRMRRLLTGVAVPHSTPDGTAVYTSWLSDQRLIAPMVILPHAWRRYRERMYYIVVCKDDEEKVRAAMKQHSEIEVVGYVVVWLTLWQLLARCSLSERKRRNLYDGRPDATARYRLTLTEEFIKR